MAYSCNLSGYPTCITQDAEFFEAKKARGGRNGPGGGGYGNGRPSPGPPPRRPAAPPVNELDEGGDVTDAAIAAMARGALNHSSCH